MNRMGSMGRQRERQTDRQTERERERTHKISIAAGGKALYNVNKPQFWIFCPQKH